jgi:hypothetical protein
VQTEPVTSQPLAPPNVFRPNDFSGLDDYGQQRQDNLSSPVVGVVTGQTLVVDAGMSLSI